MTVDAPGKVQRALLSVFNKDNLLELGRGLADAGVEILASGGTSKKLQEAGIPVVPVEDYTKSPEVLGGRVKTLHPKIHAGILADRRKDDHLADLEKNEIGPIDLVVCNLYPFTDVLAQGAEHQKMVEMIDIGGPTMVRAAAKNCDGGVSILIDPADYTDAVEAIKGGGIPREQRLKYAAKAFRHVADYDMAIAGWAEDAAGIDKDEGAPQRIYGFVRNQQLRYGENPHQKGYLYLDENVRTGVSYGDQLQGKALSYNNYLDLDAAYRAADGLSGNGCAIVKHTNPCGLAEGDTQAEAFKRALDGDPVSAFGGIIGFNSPLEGDTAEAIRDTKLFVECIAAPDFTGEAIEAFAKRENLRLVKVPQGTPAPSWSAHRIGGGLLLQETDAGITAPEEWRCVTKKQVDDTMLAELAFAMRAVAVLKSNAITVSKDRALLGAGAGQMSRVDAAEQALKKAGGKTEGAFMASDAFFPFDDCVKLAASAGIVGVVQPGGSKRDEEVIAACDDAGIAMLFTGRRHFRH